MEEGSPEVFLKHYKLPKWSRAANVGDVESELNFVRNVGIDVNSLEAEYEGLNDDEDVTVSRGDRGPCI
ncbi:unnamed protein product [Prunus armeniaca]